MALFRLFKSSIFRIFGFRRKFRPAETIQLAPYALRETH